MNVLGILRHRLFSSSNGRILNQEREYFWKKLVKNILHQNSLPVSTETTQMRHYCRLYDSYFNCCDNEVDSVTMSGFGGT